MERFPSGQRDQTVNLTPNSFEGSNPSLSTIYCFTALSLGQPLGAGRFRTIRCAESTGWLAGRVLHPSLLKRREFDPLTQGHT